MQCRIVADNVTGTVSVTLGKAIIVEDTAEFPGSNMVSRNIRDQKTEIKRNVGLTEMKAKLVGTYAAYSRGLTPRYEVCRAVR